jgi:hypothetical protein
MPCLRPEALRCIQLNDLARDPVGITGGVFVLSRDISVAAVRLIRQEAFLVDAGDRIAKHLVAARETTGRASTVRKRAFATVMDHCPGRSATKASLGGAVLPPLGVGELRPGEDRSRDRSYR